MRHPEDRVPDKRPQQPADGATAGGDQAEHEEGIEAEDVDLLDVESGEDGHAAGGGEEGAEERGGEVVAAAGLAQREVGVPGQGVEEV